MALGWGDGLVLVIPEDYILEFDGLGATNGRRCQCLTRAESEEEAHDCKVGERLVD